MTQRNPLHPVASVAGTQWRLALAVAAVPLLAALPARTARAQYQIQNGGHANDANNQIGSGGYNNTLQRGSTINNNNIIYNNVTRGFGFTGRVQEKDPTSFSGNLPGLTVDRFTANSNPAAVRGTPSANTVAPTVQPFYGETRFIAPQGFVSTLGNNGYVPAGTNQASSYTPNMLPNGTTGGSFQTGTGTNSTITGNLSPVFSNGAYAPYGLDVVRLGPADANNQQTLLVVSPGFGIQQTALDNSTADYFSGRTTSGGALGVDRSQRLSPDQLRQIRDELEQPGGIQNQPNRTNQQNPSNPSNPSDPSNPAPGALPNGQPAPAPGQLSRALPQPVETPSNQALSNQELGSSLNSSQPLSGGLQTGAGPVRPLMSPGQQTPVYNDLASRVREAYPDAPGTATEPAPATPGTGRPGAGSGTTGAQGATGVSSVPGMPNTAGPGGPRAPGATGSPAPGRPNFTGLPSGTGRGTAGPGLPPAARPGETNGSETLAGGTRNTPVRITSLASGVKAPKFADLLKSAEELTKQGKYASSIQQYATAEVVAPNNPLIPVGQAIAELGAQSYRDAESQLRRSFAGDPALLHAQFDLTTFLGAKRLGEITDDLKGLAAKEPRSELPAFLLAFISYNTGHEADAANYLTDAEKREGRADPVIQRMRQHWNLPGAGGSNAQNPAPAGGPSLNK